MGGAEYQIWPLSALSRHRSKAGNLYQKAGLADRLGIDRG
jgi:hypothetical protein